MRGLTQRFEGRTLFESVDLDAGSSGGVAVCGPSGVGKSRLLRAIAGLDPFVAGTVTLDGRTPAQMGVPSWRAAVVYVAQSAPELDGTAARWRAEIAGYAVRRGHPLDDTVAIARRWGVPSELWDAPWARLSGGERQRLILAVAVATRPRVLLLDEVTSSLDPVATAAVEATLTSYPAIWVTHDAAQAARVATTFVELA